MGPVVSVYVVLPAGSADNDVSVLARSERQRAAQFRFEHDRSRYVRAHNGLRRVLGQHLDAHPASLEFGAGRRGKPFLVGHEHLQFNLSHSGEHVVIAVSEDTPLGIDVEADGRPIDVDALATTVMTSEEQRLGVLWNRAVFQQFWSRKEAVMKATGHGLHLAPSSFAVWDETGPLPQVQVSGLQSITVCALVHERLPAATSLAVVGGPPSAVHVTVA